MKQYCLVTQWQLEAPIEPVWDALITPEDWPLWWRYVVEVVDLEKGDADGVGALRRYTWASKLPYRLSFEMRTTIVTRPSTIAGTASGDLNGTGRWQLRTLGNTTLAQYEWTVMTGKSWMNAFAPILAPVFAWNHDQVMKAGGEGLAQHLGVRLASFSGSSGHKQNLTAAA